MVKINRNKKSTFNKMLADILKVAEIEKFKRLVRANRSSLEIDYWWLYYIDENIRLIFILVKEVLILVRANYLSIVN
ncbi:hypothetical protein [Spiroplasma poulsonii]|uniref:hypothetical protein n=1 Tax=Spiroplasma poulsonii TaxID=2138 RepID=UPI001F4CF304|nr:hypothetical protein [Spiroplasma poulsonii]UNF62097.1 hypothetical protein MNU24_01125 [Spiroplasma poulsonii]